MTQSDPGTPRRSAWLGHVWTAGQLRARAESPGRKVLKVGQRAKNDFVGDLQAVENGVKVVLLRVETQVDHVAIPNSRVSGTRRGWRRRR